MKSGKMSLMKLAVSYREDQLIVPSFFRIKTYIENLTNLLDIVQI